jgi:uncharacterized membrane protein
MNGLADVADTATAPRAADAVVRASRMAAVASVIGLIALGLAWELWLAPTGSGTLALKVLPLLLPLAGLLRHRMYTYRWLSLFVWLYFAEGVVRATSEQGTGRVLALVEVVLCLVLFTACALHVRWRLREASREAARAAARAPA